VRTSEIKLQLNNAAGDRLKRNKNDKAYNIGKKKQQLLNVKFDMLQEISTGTCNCIAL